MQRALRSKKRSCDTDRSSASSILLIHKMKELCVTFSKTKCKLPSVFIGDEPIEQVQTTKLLDAILSQDLTWGTPHLAQVCAKTSARLHFLRHLNRSGASQSDMIIYTASIRSIMEYACQA